ncbi:MAG TPA: urea ABC transporter permease subunit UrtB, partial [Polyangiales bacterium]|nr:urea ABC transporter permease subunit UrtB [Polyangiales bacterium]
CLFLGFALPAAADSGELGALISALGSSDRAQAGSAVDALALRSEPQALTALTALRDGQLLLAANGQVLIQQPDGVVDAVSGKRVEPAPKADVVVLNNTLRRQVSPAIAALGLRSNVRDTRLSAAIALSRNLDEKLVPPLRAALRSEKDAEVRRVLAQALAQADLVSSDPKLRLAAVQAMGDSKDVAFKASLAALTTRDGSGNYGEKDETVREAAASALSAIERKELFTRIVRDLFYGLSLGSVLLLAALGLAVTFGLMRVINMAHGEMLMLGAYSTYVAQRAFEVYLPGAFDYYMVLAIPLAFVVCMAMGMLLERTVIRFLYGRPLETLLATWGISLFLIQTVRLIFGAQNVTVANPSWLSGGYELLAGVVLPFNRIATILFVSMVVLFVNWLLKRTPLGLQVRAITQNRGMAACMGIPTARVDMLTFGVGSGIAGLGGVALSQLGNVGPELGQLYIVDSFLVVVVGGVGKIAGSVVAAVGLGTINKVLEPFAGAVLGKIFLLVFVVLFIQRRPQGLFALKGRSAES